MTDAQEAPGSKPPGPVRRAGARLAALIRTRVELFSVEFQLEKSRMLGLFLLAAAAGGLTILGATVLSVAVVLVLPEESRIPAMFGLGALYLMLALGLVLLMRARLARHRPFRHTMEEIEKDKACLEGRRSAS